MPDYGSLSVSTQEFRPQDLAHDEFRVCSVTETASNIVSIMTGAGMLSLPFVASTMGWSSIGLLLIIAATYMYMYYLVAESIRAVVYERKTTSNAGIIDYATLGRISLGKGGEKVTVVLGIEFFLALISLYINVGINLNLIFPVLSITHGIIIGCFISLILANTNIKIVSWFAAFGNSMTILAPLALIFSGFELPFSFTERNYQLCNFSHVPLAVGIFFFCFAGHGAL